MVDTGAAVRRGWPFIEDEQRRTSTHVVDFVECILQLPVLKNPLFNLRKIHPTGN